MRSGLALYAACAAIVLLAGSAAFLLADDSAATLRLVAGLLFWGAGVSLTVIGLIALGRRLGIRRTPS